MAGAEAQARASLDMEVRAVDQTGQLRGIDFDVSGAAKCAWAASCLPFTCLGCMEAAVPHGFAAGIPALLGAGCCRRARTCNGTIHPHQVPPAARSSWPAGAYATWTTCWC